MANIKDHVSVIREGQDLLPGGEGQDFWPPHAPTHEQGGTDVINVEGLLGTLADPQNAGWVQGRPISTGAPNDGDALVYSQGSNEWVYAPPIPGASIWAKDAGGGFLYPVTSTDRIRTGSGSAGAPGYAFLSGGTSGFFWDSHPALSLGGLKVWRFEQIANALTMTSNYRTRILAQHNGAVVNSEARADFGAISASSGNDATATLFAEHSSGSSHVDIHAISGGLSSAKIDLYAKADAGTDTSSYLTFGGTANGSGLRYLALGGTIDASSMLFDSIRFGTRSLDSAPAWTQDYLEFCEPGNTTQWVDYRINFGEVSLIQALNAAYAQAGVSAHNYLTGIQGGLANEYYHFSAANYGYLTTNLPIASGRVIFANASNQLDSDAGLTFDTAYDTLSITNSVNQTNWYDANAETIKLIGTATQGQVISTDQNLTLGVSSSLSTTDRELNLVVRSTGLDADTAATLLSHAVGAGGESPPHAEVFVHALSENGDATAMMKAEVYGTSETAVSRIQAIDNSNSTYMTIERTSNVGSVVFGLVNYIEFNGADLRDADTFTFVKKSASFFSGTLNVDATTGNAQTVEIDADVTTFTIGAPTSNSVTRLSLWVKNTDASSHDIGGLSGYNLISPLADGYELGAGDTVHMTLIYRDSTWGWDVALSEYS